MLCYSFRHAVVFVQTPDVENEDVVAAAPTGDVSTTSEWSTILLPTKVQLTFEVWRYIIFGAAFWHQGRTTFADDIYRSIFHNVACCISIHFSIKFVLKGPTNNKNSVGLDNGLVLNKRQTIIEINDALIYWRIHGPSGQYIYIYMYR